MKKTLILDQAAISQKTRRIAYQIVEDNYDEKEIIMIGIDGTGHEYAQLLKKEIESISEISIKLYALSLDKQKPLSKPITIDAPKLSLDNKVVLMVDDVANTGKTMYYALKPVMEFSPKKVQVAVLVDRQHKLFPVSSDFVGLSLSTTMQEHIRVELAKAGKAEAYLI
ncbi:MAG: phosphoribosyltransferase [Bacteroidetes bacterium]|nr:phosphoribosyltransferase [Bacteroidota bacterium]